MSMTPLNLDNVIDHSTVRDAVRRGRQLRAEAVREMFDQLFHVKPRGGARIG